MFGTNLFCLIKKVGFRSEFCTKLVKSEKKNVNAYFQAIGTGGAGDSASVCLKIDRKNYIFNCGENFIRVTYNSSIRLNKENHIFITQAKWNQMGGLSDLLNRYSMKIYGPKSLEKLILRMTAFFTTLSSKWKYISSDAYEDENIHLQFIAVRAPNDRKHVSYIYLGRIKSIRDVHFHDFSSNMKIGEQFCEQKTFPSPTEFKFVVLDIPRLSYMKDLKAKNVSNVFDFMFHFTPQNVIDSMEYRTFLRTQKECIHIKLNESNDHSSLKTAYELQNKLNRIDASVFPMLRSNKATEYNWKFNVSTDDAIYPNIVILGTSSTYSRSIRTVSAILIHINKDNCILFDCGQGTCGQIQRFYGREAREIFEKIKIVYISHMHADHHFGLLRLLELRKQLLKKARTPLILLSPIEETQSWIYFYDKNYENIRLDLKIIDNSKLENPQTNFNIFGIKSLQTCFVNHVKNSFGISITLPYTNESNECQEQFKITYSGDTRPCEQLVRLGKSSTLLLHEATFSDELVAHAEKHGHCTISQAIEQSQKMNAKHTILTHFSTRYKFPVLDFNKISKNVSVACDNMIVNVNHLDKLNEISRKVENIFKEF